MAANTALIGIAGVHHVVSELSLRGMVALPTVRNTAGVDIVVANAHFTRHAYIQVKASNKRVTGFPMPAADKVRTGPRDFYVLARWREGDRRFECFMLTGREAKAEVLRTDKIKDAAILAGRKKASVFIHHVSVAPIDRPEVQRWSTAWERWAL